MKFGQHLKENIFPPWRMSYLQYDSLKYDLKSRQLDHPWSTADELNFRQKILVELAKVHEFIISKTNDLGTRIQRCENDILQSIRISHDRPKVVYATLDAPLLAILHDINSLVKFTRLNYIGFQKMLKKHDKWTQMNLQQTLIPHFHEHPLDNQRFDQLLARVSHLRELLRSLSQTDRDHDANNSWSPERTDTRTITKTYWIHPDNLTKVKAILQFHMPARQYEATDETGAAVSSVYFDNPNNFNQYISCLQRDTGAESVWLQCGSSSTGSVGGSVRMNTDQIAQFIAGHLTPGQIVAELREQDAPLAVVREIEQIASSVQQSICRKKLEPVLRCVYNRTSFRYPGHDKTWVYLDSDVWYIREDNLGKHRRAAGAWRREDVNRLDEEEEEEVKEAEEAADIYRFPYAVLEIKQGRYLQTPEWLTQMNTSHLVHEVPRFSKYLHGASQLYQLPLLPWWLSELRIDIRGPQGDSDLGHAETLWQLPQEPVGRLSSMTLPPFPPEHGSSTIKMWAAEQSLPGDRDRNRKALAWLRKRWRKSKTEGGQILPLSKVKIEPKTFFANERTFLSWLQFCALLLTVSLSLLNFGDHLSRIIGGFFIVISALLAVYALWRFQYRAWQIRTRNTGRYDDLYGPAVLCLLLLVALIVNFCLRFQQPAPTSPLLYGSNTTTSNT
ncbi:vacuolar transporter chaperone [Apophysomyces sp. BC1034]|nr:vacuolar transporter chaperone [Apophysomyces sp. BC1015]KAG0181062.1 vacuolar transporter chaperone [Apophysomyces sp. BC1021]KAG0191469.1 vacuolar transporter chaperone [Apophysomyces sp. BC1034]